MIRAEGFDEEGRLTEWTFDNAQHAEIYCRQVYVYDGQGRLAEESLHREGELRSKTSYLYDSQDNLVQRLSFGADGAPTSKSEIVYGEDGKKLEESSFDDSGKLITKTEFAYQANGNRAEESSFDYGEYDFQGDRGYGIDANPGYDYSFTVGSGQVRLEKKIYDQNGNPRELQLFDEEGRLLTRVVFTADELGRIVKHAQFGAGVWASDIPEGAETPPEVGGLFSGESALSGSEIVYNAEGRKLEDRMIFSGAVFQRSVYTYDARGELSEECTINADGTVRSKAQVHREYDSHGNWIEELVSSWNAEKGAFEPSLVERREITYW